LEWQPGVAATDVVCWRVEADVRKPTHRLSNTQLVQTGYNGKPEAALNNIFPYIQNRFLFIVLSADTNIYNDSK
jgi:hypothetical protein